MVSSVVAVWCLALCTIAVESRGRTTTKELSREHRWRDDLQTTSKDYSSSWDHYVLAEITPPGECYIFKLNGNGGACKYPSNSTLWTIHGLWYGQNSTNEISLANINFFCSTECPHRPTLGNTLGPNWCGNCTVEDKNCTNATFRADDITDLVSTLAKFWPNIEIETPYYSFWAHEWLKHGTCTDMNEKTFFRKVLNLFESGLNYGLILDKSGIVPSSTKTYDTKDFIAAFDQHLGVEPLLFCDYSKSAGQTLHQIEICLDKNYHVMDCPRPASRRGLCWSSEPVHYIP